MRLHFTVSILALAGLLVAACGGGGGGGNDADGLEQAAEDFGNALFSADTEDAYEFLSEECKDSVSSEEFQGTMAFAILFMTALLELEPGDIEVDTVETRNVEDGRGETLVTFKAPGADSEDLNSDSDWEEWVYEDGGWKIADCSDFEGGFGNGSSDDDDAEPLTGPGSSRDEPAPLGTPVEVAGWELTVNSADPDAADEIVSDDTFIDPPEPGEVFYLVNLTTTYVGNGEDESNTLFFSFDFSAVGDSAVAYDLFDDACTLFDLPDELDQNAEVFEGGTISGNICFSVDEDDAGSLLLSAEQSFGFGDGQRAWFELR